MCDNNICWTCSKALTELCPKHANKKVERMMWRSKMTECSEYDYDGECLNCPLNTNKEHRAIYDTCPYFINGYKGYCSQENWKRGNYEIEWVENR